MAGSSQLFINHLLPKGAHSAIVCGQTGCGKTVFVLSLLKEGPYRAVTGITEITKITTEITMEITEITTKGWGGGEVGVGRCE